MTDALAPVLAIVGIAAALYACALWWQSGGHTRSEAWATLRRALADRAALRASRIARDVERVRARMAREDERDAARDEVARLRRELAEAEARWLTLDPEAARAGGIERVRAVR